MNNSSDNNNPNGDSKKPDIEIEADDVQESDIDSDKEKESRRSINITEDSDPTDILEKREEQRAMLTRAHQLAVGMCFDDRSLFPLWIAFLALPSIAMLITPIASAAFQVACFLGHQIVMMLFFYSRAHHWVEYFRGQDYKAEKEKVPVFKRFAIFTLALWFPQFFPSVIRYLVTDESFVVIFSAVYFAGLLFYFQFFFYFIPLLMGAKRSNAIFQESHQIVRQYKMLPLLAVTIPFLLVMIPDGVLTALSPDHRYVLVPCLISLVESCYWIIHVYLSLAYGLIFCPDPLWQRYNMDRYRNARFAPVMSLSFKPVVNLLSRGNLLKFFFLGLLISVANMARLTSMKPAPTIQVTAIEVIENTLKVSLSIEDAEFHYRGFHPRWLLLAGPKGNTEILDPTAPFAKILINDEPFKLGSLERLFGRHARLSVEFKTTRKGEELQKLEDLFLWYSSYKLLHLDMSTASIVNIKGSTENQEPQEPKER